MQLATRRNCLGIVAAMAIGVGLTTTCRANNTWTVGKEYPATERVSIDKIDHSTWDKLLQKYVDEQGLVDYAAWKQTRADFAALKSYLAQLSQADPQRAAAKPAVLAFWINAYNAVTIRGILREYPTDTIRDHTARFFGYNIWEDLLLQVGKQEISLDSIENEVLRKQGEPRIHFAIVCASIGCPRLLNHAYQPDKLDAQLTANAKKFFANPEKFRVAAAGKHFELSPILNWFAEDFGKTKRQRLQQIAPYLPTKAAQELARHGDVKISYLSYDWSLNDQQRKQ